MLTENLMGDSKQIWRLPKNVQEENESVALVKKHIISWHKGFD